MKILILAYLNQNFGDDLFVEMLCKRYPQHDFYFFTEIPAYKSHFSTDNLHVTVYPRTVVKINRTIFRKTSIDILNLLTAEKCDAAVMIGGSIFMEFEKSYSEKVLRERMRVSRRFPNYYIISANFGPYTNPSFLEGHKAWFRSLSDVCFRDDKSYRLFRELPNARYSLDASFQYPVMPMPKKKKIAISCMNRFPGISDDVVGKYLFMLADLSKHYMSLGYEVDLLALCSKLGDYEAAKTIKAEAGNPQGINIIQYDDDVEKIVNTINECQYIIATRFHAMALALRCDVPFLPIVYSEKMTNLLADIHFQGLVTTPDTISNYSIEQLDNNRVNDRVFFKDFARENEQFAALDDFLQHDKKVK